MLAKKTMSLREAFTLGRVCRLQRDNFNVGDFSLLSDGATVWLHEQKVGEGPSQRFQIPKHTFELLLRRYEKQQKLTARSLP